MTLVWPEEDEGVVMGESRLHALVIGVGHYHHLGLGVPKPANFLNGLAPLTTTTPTALRIAHWLTAGYHNPGCPLSSVELLLSPTETLTRPDGSEIAVEDSTMENIEDALERWYKRCNSDQRNIALFYFAGHGLSTASQFLLASDFGNPDVPDDWKNCIDATGLQTGMLKSAADTQLFFLDTCRDAPIPALTQRNPHGNPLVSSSFGDTVDVSVAYRAASIGRKAYGRDGEETWFCKALMTCLSGVGSRKAGPGWRVDTAMLSMAMGAVLDIFAKTENLPLSCDCPVVKPVPFHFPPVPRVVVKVDCNHQDASIELTLEDNVLSSPSGEDRPWVDEVTAGEARFEVTFPAKPPVILEDQLIPPTYEWDVTP